jgi:hypothetical protein
LKGKSILKLIVAEISAVAINIIPAALWFFEDASAETAMILYGLENVFAVVLAGLCVFLLAPVWEASDQNEILERRAILRNHFLGGVAFTVFLLGFITLYILVSQRGELSFSIIKYALPGILAFQLFEFFSNLYLLRPLSLRQGEILLSHSLGKVIFLHISIFIGFFLTIYGDEWFVVPFIVLKTIINVLEPIQYFLGKKPTVSSIFSEMSLKS